MEEFAGESLVKVEALVSLSAPVVKIKLAQLPDLGRVGVVGVEALHGGLLTLSLHEQAADLRILRPPLAPPFLSAMSVISLPLPLLSVSPHGW